MAYRWHVIGPNDLAAADFEPLSANLTVSRMNRKTAKTENKEST
jgi:hypothetical protein